MLHVQIYSISWWSRHVLGFEPSALGGSAAPPRSWRTWRSAWRRWRGNGRHGMTSESQIFPHLYIENAIQMGSFSGVTDFFGVFENLRFLRSDKVWRKIFYLADVWIHESRTCVHLRHIPFVENQVHGVPHLLLTGRILSARAIWRMWPWLCPCAVSGMCQPSSSSGRLLVRLWLFQSLKASTSQWTACLFPLSDLGVSHMAWLRNEALKLMDDLEPAAWTL